jgi:ELWxxDGT repeat protein
LFMVNNQTNGWELWKSDGTAAGTLLVKDIWPSTAGSYPQFLTNVNGSLFFTAYDPMHGAELWGLDLTPPSSTITAPVAGESVRGTSYTVSGTASDLMSGVAMVEVSTDSGATWISATDTSGNGTWSTWSYDWPLPADGAHTVTVRATDLSGNVQVPGTVVPVTKVTPVDGACGASNGQAVTVAPSANLCSAGIASTLTGSGPWSWSCAGSNGGTTASCSAALLKTGIVNAAPGKTKPDITDALRALNIVVGNITPTTTDYAQLDVAPLDGSGRPKGDHVIDVYDVIGVLRMMLGLL